MSGYETEMLLVKVLTDLGYVVNQEPQSIASNIRSRFDMIIEKDDDKFVVEIKKGFLGVEHFRNLLAHKECFDEYINLGYKVLLICDKDKVDKRLINNLEKMDVIIWDINKIIETQKELYSLPKNIKE